MPSTKPTSHPPADRAALVRELALEGGFALCGIAPAEPSDYGAFFRQWLGEGRHGEMHYLAENLEVRLDPRKLLPGARALICVADFYPDEQATQTQARETDAEAPARGRVARYAWGDDYHKVIKKRLHALADALGRRWGEAEFKCVVDTAPAMEREHAARAGLGWVGKHTLLLHPRYGSWMLLGMIATTLELETAAEAGYPLPLVPPTDHCGTCTRCIDACPTGCIEDPAETGRRSLDATRCISYLTLEHRSLIDEALHEPMGDWIAGCDVCQEVCPYNRMQSGKFKIQAGGSGAAGPTFGPPLVHVRYAPRAVAEGLDLLAVLGWSGEDRQRAFRGSALKRMKLEMVKRNALIAAGNRLQRTERPALRAKVAALAEAADEPALVRETARQVLARLAESAVKPEDGEYGRG